MQRVRKVKPARPDHKDLRDQSGLQDHREQRAPPAHKVKPARPDHKAHKVKPARPDHKGLLDQRALRERPDLLAQLDLPGHKGLLDRLALREQPAHKVLPVPRGRRVFRECRNFNMSREHR